MRNNSTVEQRSAAREDADAEARASRTGAEPGAKSSPSPASRGLLRTAAGAGLALVILGAGACGGPRVARVGATRVPAGPLAPKRDDKSGLRRFAELKAECTERTGFFDTYLSKKDDKLYIAVPKDRLGQEFLLQAQIARGIGRRPLFSGILLKSALVALERHGERVYLVERPVRYTAGASPAYQRAVEQTYTPSVLESARIESIRPDGAVLLRVDEWLLGDLADVGEDAAAAFLRTGKGKLAPNRDRSFVESVKAFPDNVHLRARLTYAPSESVPLATVPDGRFPSLTVAFSLARLPAQPMAPRMADDRVGYFITARKDWSSDDPEHFARYIHRWRLEAERRDGELLVPKKPITYYLDPSVPPDFRPHVREGVEAWNRAFTSAGWKNAIRVADLPPGADPDDVRYAVIRWDTSEEAPIGIGQSVVDPRTGEVLSASIVITADLLRHNTHSQHVFFGKPGATSLESLASLDEPEPADAHRRMGLEPLSFGSELEAQGALARVFLSASSPVVPGDAAAAKLLGQELRFTSMHEVGHTLGLRHNFRASAETPLDKLADKGWADARGLTGSIMDYPGVNLPKGAAPADWNYYPPMIGSADLWSIAVGYMPDEARARKLARQGAQPGHALGTDEESSLLYGLDPRVQQWDLGEEPLAWARDRIDLIRGLWKTLPERSLRDDSRYAELTDNFTALLSQYARAVSMVARYVGGQYVSRDHVGDPGARPPFAPVPRAVQREALDLLVRVLFGEEAWDLPPTTLARLAPSNFRHWGQTQGFDRRRDFPIHDSIARAQGAMLHMLTSTAVFSRLQDAELKFDTKETLPLAEYLDVISQAMWSEFKGPSPRPVSSLRRELQAAYVERLGSFVRDADSDRPADVRALARLSLIDLKKRLDTQPKPATLDVYTRAHVHELSVRIAKLLDARIKEKD